jgi:sRNA-binding regulator protein Hfq
MSVSRHEINRVRYWDTDVYPLDIQHLFGLFGDTFCGDEEEPIPRVPVNTDARPILLLPAVKRQVTRFETTTAIVAVCGPLDLESDTHLRRVLREKGGFEWNARHGRPGVTLYAVLYLERHGSPTVTTTCSLPLCSHAPPRSDEPHPCRDAPVGVQHVCPLCYFNLLTVTAAAPPPPTSTGFTLTSSVPLLRFAAHGSNIHLTRGVQLSGTMERLDRFCVDHNTTAIVWKHTPGNTIVIGAPLVHVPVTALTASVVTCYTVALGERIFPDHAIRLETVMCPTVPDHIELLRLLNRAGFTRAMTHCTPPTARRVAVPIIAPHSAGRPRWSYRNGLSHQNMLPVTQWSTAGVHRRHHDRGDSCGGERGHGSTVVYWDRPSFLRMCAIVPYLHLSRLCLKTQIKAK